MLLLSWAVGVILWASKSAQDVDIAALKVLLTFMNGLCTFLLGLFISLSLSRWWSMRHSCLGELWKAVAEITLVSCTYLKSNSNTNSTNGNTNGNTNGTNGTNGTTTDTHNDKLPTKQQEQHKLKKELTRMGLLSFLLLFKDARAEPDSTDSSYLRSFEERGLCTAQEATVLRRVSVKSAIPWVWALDLIARALENGTIPATLRFDLQGCCMRGRTAVQHTLTYVQTPLPLMYVHLVVLLVKATSVVWSFFVGANLAHVSDRCAIAQYAYVCV